MSSLPKARVLIVDDSALARSAIRNSITFDPGIEVVGMAADAYEAREKIISLRPDVITLDLEMPRLDGLTFLKILREHHPIPVIIISSFTPQGSSKALEALEAGAFEVFGKQSGAGMVDFGPKLARLIKGAAASNRTPERSTEPVPSPVANPPGSPVQLFPEKRVLVIGASTGGVEALRDLLPRLPAQIPPIVVVQHIPKNFSRLMAERLDQLCPFTVREAVDGEALRSGLCLIAPGDFHLALTSSPPGYQVRLAQSPPVHHCRPAVDILFRSAAMCAGSNAVAVLLTGMGVDGARGMQELRSAGAHTIGQDEKSSVVYGMPAAAFRLGAVVQQLPLSRMSEAILKALGQPAGKSKS